MRAYFVALGLTLLVELLVALAFDRRSLKLLLAVVLVNLVTHPLFGATLWAFPNLRGVPAVPILEIVIIFAEALLLIVALPGRGKRFLFALSFCMNAASYVTGALIFKHWG